MTEFSLASQPRYVYPIIPTIDKAPTKTFQMASERAFGLNFDITKPDDKIPNAEKAKATVPVTRLDTDADCLYCNSIYFGVKIQYGM